MAHVLGRGTPSGGSPALSLGALVVVREAGAGIADCYGDRMSDVDVRSLRLRLGLTQAQVAEQAGVAQPEISAVENGTARATPEARLRVLNAIRALARPEQALTPEVREQAHDLFEQVGATQVAIFGSVARGTAKPGSDIDLVAKFPPEFSLFDMIGLAESLEALIGVSVDIVSDDPRAGEVIEHIRATSVPLVG